MCNADTKRLKQKCVETLLALLEGRQADSVWQMRISDAIHERTLRDNLRHVYFDFRNVFNGKYSNEAFTDLKHSNQKKGADQERKGADQDGTLTLGFHLFELMSLLSNQDNSLATTKLDSQTDIDNSDNSLMAKVQDVMGWLQRQMPDLSSASLDDLHAHTHSPELPSWVDTLSFYQQKVIVHTEE